MKNKFTISILLMIILGLSIYYFISTRHKRFIGNFIENVEDPNFENGNGQYIASISIEGKKVYWTSADSCGNSTDNFDLCVIYFPDGNIYIESSKHYCGYEGTSGFIRKLQREDLKTFTESIKKAGFKHYKLVSLKK